MLTNPNTLGLFEEEIEEIAGSCTASAALVYYDGANLNAILGRCRARATWASTSCTSTRTRRSPRPHGGGGPGAGPVGVAEELAPYLPAPIVAGTTRRGRSIGTDDRPDSIGRVHGFHGNFGVLVRAYAYVFLHGRDGLKAVSELASLNANYLAALVAEDFPLAFPAGGPCTSSSRPRSD